MDHFKNGHTLSCGCLLVEKVREAATGKNRSKVLLGEKYGSLKVIERKPNTAKGEAVYLCRCDCGTVYAVTGQRLSGGSATQCRKCGFKKHLSEIHKLRTKAPGQAACRAALLANKRGAAQRGLLWEISFEDWQRLTSLPCRYCGSPSSNESKGGCGRNGSYHYNGLDRVDNNMGYVLSNVVPCCKWCNKAKSTRTTAQFIDWAQQVVRHNYATK